MQVAEEQRKHGNSSGRYNRAYTAQVRFTEAVRLYREERLTMQEIGARLGVSKTQVYRYLKELWDRASRASEEEVRAWRESELAEIERDEEIAEQIRDRMQDEDPRVALEAIDKRNKLRDRRAKMMALDAPVKTEVSGTINVQALPAPELNAQILAEAVKELEGIGWDRLPADLQDRLSMFVVRPAALLTEGAVPDAEVLEGELEEEP